jgi:hypothetical protein
MRISRESIGKCALRCAVIAILFIFPALLQAQSRIVTVSPVPGDPVASGTALRNALAGIPSPSATNPWLLKIAWNIRCSIQSIADAVMGEHRRFGHRSDNNPRGCRI